MSDLESDTFGGSSVEPWDAHRRERAVEALAEAIHSASGHWAVTQRYTLDQCECRRRADGALRHLVSNPSGGADVWALLDEQVPGKLRFP